MARPVTRSSFLPLIALTWVFSTVALGLSAYLVKSATSFPGLEGRRVTVEGVFAFAWITLFSTILLVGTLVAPTSVFFGAGLSFAILFLGFLLSVVGLSSITSLINLYGLAADKSLWKAYEGIGWCATFFTLFAAFAAGHSYIKNKPAPPSHKEDA